MLPSRTALSSTITNQLTVYTTTANNSDHLFSNLPLHSLAYCRLSYSPDSQSSSNYFWIFYPLLLLLQLAYPPKHAEDFLTLSWPNPLWITSEGSYPPTILRVYSDSCWCFPTLLNANRYFLIVYPFLPVLPLASPLKPTAVFLTFPSIHNTLLKSIIPKTTTMTHPSVLL